MVSGKVVALCLQWKCRSLLFHTSKVFLHFISYRKCGRYH
jgi:hypothetical protein